MLAIVIISIGIIIFVLFITHYDVPRSRCCSNDISQDMKIRDILIKMFSNGDISIETFSKYIDKNMDKKSMLITMIEKNEIDGSKISKYWDM
jgi:uncharacterized membrane protein